MGGCRRFGTAHDTGVQHAAVVVVVVVGGWVGWVWGGVVVALFEVLAPAVCTGKCTNRSCGRLRLLLRHVNRSCGCRRDMHWLGLR
jgi:hypothetical protein